MNLTPREKDKLLVAMAAMVARKRLEKASNSIIRKRWPLSPTMWLKAPVMDVQLPI